MPETTLVSSRTLSFWFPLIAFSWSSFNTTLTPAIRDHCSSFNSLISGVKVSQSEFQIYTFLHHRIHCLIIGHRYLLKNFHFFHNFHFWRQNSYFVNLVRYFFLPLFSICDNQVLLSSDEYLHIVQFQYRLEFLRLTYFLNLYKLSRTSSGGIFVIDNCISSHLVSNS